MNFKRVLKTALSLVMIAVLAVSMFACTPEQKETEDEKVFENQLVNDRYRFSQGYPEDWDYTQGEGGAELREFYAGKGVGWLVTKFVSKTNPNLIYTVYKYNPGTGAAAVAPSTWMGNLMETGDRVTYKFNDYFTEEKDAFRSDFAVSSSTYTEKAYIPQVTWFEVNYDFTLDNEDWKGSYHVTPASEGGLFFLVTCEAKAADWDAAQATFADMLKDFRDLGR
ncbi:MAG: hypothetical protein IKU26_06265 [Clostridia bacterium]|nr:hypothetical protein [Clostridia bacterium]